MALTTANACGRVGTCWAATLLNVEAPAATTPAQRVRLVSALAETPCSLSLQFSESSTHQNLHTNRKVTTRYINEEIPSNTQNTSQKTATTSNIPLLHVLMIDKFSQYERWRVVIHEPYV